MPIPTYDVWIADTKQGVFTPRSKQLEEVDKAVKAYNLAKTDQNKAMIKTKLQLWKDFKGAGWKTSVRNHKKAVENLDAAVNPYRAGAVAWTAPPLPVMPVPGEIYLAPSFQFANSLARTQVPIAINRAKKLIDSAYRGINQARISAGADRDIYETWFGTFDANRFSTVRDNIISVYDALFVKGVLLYYRGDGATGPTDCAAENGNISGENFFGAAWKAADTPASLNKRCTHIFLGKAFFASGVYALDSAGGVIIHELTHAICGTDDVDYKGEETYGTVLCKRLATERPDLAITNADSYEYLCENYQDKNYVPKAVPLNLPKKASISLTF